MTATNYIKGAELPLQESFEFVLDTEKTEA